METRTFWDWSESTLSHNPNRVRGPRKGPTRVYTIDSARTLASTFPEMYNGPKKNIRMVFQQQPPPVWYKDQAHEPKYFCVVVMLKDELGRRVKGLDVPLKAKLLFANGEVVNRQGILKLSKDSVPERGRGAEDSRRFGFEES